MSVITLLILVLLIGGLFWANNTYIAPGILRTVFNVVLVIVSLFIILSVAGLIGSIGSYRIGR